MTAKPPILITGSHRSGSTWVGKMLSESPSTLYIDEPFNLHHHLLFQPSIFEYWFTYVSPENEDQYLNYINQAINTSYEFVFDRKMIKTWRDRQTLIQTYLHSLKQRLRGARPLVKDPIALFSAEWLATRFTADVVVLIRHPAAFAYSLKRAGWGHPFTDFLNQPLLMQDYLFPFQNEIEEYAQHQKGILEQATLLWKLIHYMIGIYKDKYPNWVFVRHEDLSRDPIAGFQQLFNQLNLEFNSSIQTTIEDYSRAGTPSATLGFSKRDSRANIFSWKTGLSVAEIVQIKTQVEDVSRLFYSDQDW